MDCRPHDRHYVDRNPAGEELESLDITAPAQPSRESRLQERRDRLNEGEVKEGDEEDSALDDAKHSDESAPRPSPKKAKAPAGPPPRRAQDVMDSSDEDSTGGSRPTQRPLASSEIEELRAGAGGLSIFLDDDSDEDGNVLIDIKVSRTICHFFELYYFIPLCLHICTFTPLYSHPVA